MILVAGSTGAVGSEIVRLLREKGESVRGLVRATSAPEKVARLTELGAEPVVGELKNRASLDKACEGVRTVISTVSMIGTAQPGDSFADTDKAGTISLIDAAVAAEAEHFVFLSFDAERFPDTPLTEGSWLSRIIYDRAVSRSRFSGRVRSWTRGSARCCSRTCHRGR